MGNATVRIHHKSTDSPGGVHELTVAAPTDTSHILRMATVLYLSMLPVTMMVPVLKELVAVRFEASTFATHAFMSINMIGAVLFAPIGGALADRLRRRKPILVTALAIDAVLLFAMMRATSLPILMTFRFFEGAAHITAITTLMAIAADHAGVGKRGHIMGVIGGTLIFGTACGAPLGGRLGQSDPLLVFHIGAVISLLGAALTVLGVHDASSRRVAPRMSDAVSLLGKHRELLVPYAYAFIDRFCVGVIVTTFVLFLGDVHGVTPAQRGGLLAIFLFPFALLCYPIGRLSDHIGRVWPMCLGSLGFGVVYASYGVIPMSLMPWAMLASGLLSAVMFAPNLAMCGDLAPVERRASAFAGFNMAGSLGFICGPIVGGVTLSLLNDAFAPAEAFKWAFIIAGGTEVLCALVTLPWLLRLRAAGATK